MLIKRCIPAGSWCPPEAAAVAGAVCGIVIFQFPLTALFVPFLWWLCRDRKWIFGAFAVLVTLSVWVQGNPLKPPRAEPGQWGKAILLITDPGLCRLPEIPRPGLVLAELKEFRGQDGALLPQKGKVFLRLPESFRSGLVPGDVLEGQGIYDLASGSFFRYTAARRVRGILSLDQCRVIGSERSLMYWIGLFRDRILALAIAHVEPAERRMEASTLFFGIRGGLTGAEKRDLVQAGVIHLYSVSGLHVGIFAGVLLLLLRGLPNRWKFGLLVPLTLLYAVSTGANVPALRAWIMISAWAVCRIFLYWIPVRRVLGYAAAVMLMIQPVWLYDMGFLYSFGITLILLMLGQDLQLQKKILTDPAWMMPRSPRRNRLFFFLRIRNGLLNMIAACTAAFLGGAAVGLMFQGKLLPGAVTANLLLMPVVGLLFPLMALKMSTGWLWNCWDQMLARCFEFLMNVMDIVISVVRQWDASVTGNPPLWSAILFLLGLLLLFSPETRRKWRIAGAVSCAGILIFWHGSMLFRESGVLVVYGNYAEVPAVAVADTRAGVGIVVNVPDSMAAVRMADFFLERGISRVDKVLFSGARSGNIRGMRTLVLRMQVRQVVLPEMDRYSRSFRLRLQEIRQEFPHMGETGRTTPAQLQCTPAGWRMDYRNTASGMRSRVSCSVSPEILTVNGRKIPLKRTNETVGLVFNNGF